MHACLGNSLSPSLILFLSLSFETAICTIGVYVYVKRLDERTLRYRQPTKAHHFCSNNKNDADTTTRTTRMISTTTTTQLPPRSAAKQQARDPAAADENGDNDDASASSSSDYSAIPLPTEAPVRMQSLDQSHQATPHRENSA